MSDDLKKKFFDSFGGNEFANTSSRSAANTPEKHDLKNKALSGVPGADFAETRSDKSSSTLMSGHVFGDSPKQDSGSYSSVVEPVTRAFDQPINSRNIPSSSSDLDRLEGALRNGDIDSFIEVIARNGSDSSILFKLQGVLDRPIAEEIKQRFQPGNVEIAESAIHGEVAAAEAMNIQLNYLEGSSKASAANMKRISKRLAVVRESLSLEEINSAGLSSGSRHSIRQCLLEGMNGELQQGNISPEEMFLKAAAVPVQSFEDLGKVAKALLAGESEESYQTVFEVCQGWDARRLGRVSELVEELYGKSLSQFLDNRDFKESQPNLNYSTVEEAELTNSDRARKKLLEAETFCKEDSSKTFY